MKEEKATGSKLLDSTIILAFFMDNKHKDIFESDEVLHISTLSLFEVKKRLLEKNIPFDIVSENINFMKDRLNTIDVTDEISDKGAYLSFTKKIPAIDSLIYTTAQIKNCILYTLDNDFRNLKDVVIF